MRINYLSENWNALGNVDAMWAILSDHSKAGGRWTAEEFFLTGSREITSVMDALGNLMPDLPRNTALDFGCGIGRLTKPLSEYFEYVWGVDIAKSMIEGARGASARPNVTYVVNQSDNLSIFDSDTFDFIYSNIVLQHMSNALAIGYLREFHRVLKPRGALVFQLPDNPPMLVRMARHPLMMKLYRIAPAPLLRLYRKARYPNAGMRFVTELPRVAMEMHWMPKQATVDILENIGFALVKAAPDSAAGKGWPSWQYFVRKNQFKS